MFANFKELFILEAIRDEDDFGAAMIDDVSRLLGGIGSINRDRDALNALDSKISDRPSGSIVTPCGVFEIPFPPWNLPR